MTTPKQIEPSVNNALGDLLRGMMPTCNVRSENTQTFPNHPGRHADVLITATGRSPVVVEAEFEPAPEAEKDASGRLGLKVVGEPRSIEAAVALRYPAALETAYVVSSALADANLAYCVLHEDGTRFPESGWLQGNVADLADLIRLVSVPQKEVEQAADTLEKGIEDAATAMDEMAESRPDLSSKVAGLLGMVNVPQTRRMACAIIANALIFHDRIAGMHEGIKSLHLVCGPQITNPQEETLAAWETILRINYWPIFAIAKDLLGQLSSGDATRILDQLRGTAQRVGATGVDVAHDLTGRIFQRLITDRKYLATFYTLPASAALLARLAVAKMENIDWSSAEAIGKLRVGDFACGTGALLSAVYEQIAARHERAGGNLEELHHLMIEEVLYGCDVMPSAIHITGSTLSGAQPNQKFANSRLYTMPYGRQPDHKVALGSLELLNKNSQLLMMNTSNPALRTGSAGEETAAHVMVDIPDESFDLVIMNPPFTRATNHEGSHSDVVNPAVAAFEADEVDQKEMGNRINELAKGTCYHGNAGIASAFVALADKKLKPGGVLALVLPLSAASGLSWQGLRQLLATDYDDVVVLSIAANGQNMSFSSDTGMAECLVVARKRVDKTDGETPTAQFTSLRHRPRSLAHSSAIAKNIADSVNIRGIHEGPYGGVHLSVGNDVAGEILAAPQSRGGENWGVVRLLDYSLAQTAYALADSRLWLPGVRNALALTTATLGTVGRLGLVDRDINGPAPRGPFSKTTPSLTATYPALWNHDAKEEACMICMPDSQLQVRMGMEKKAAEIWDTASRAHINRDFTFGSQALAVAFTEASSIGGRVWPNVIFEDKRLDFAFVVWGNSTLGLLSWWWHSSRQQSSKASITIRSAETLPVLDFRALSDAQLAKAEEVFDEFRTKEFQPAYLADADPNRALLDRRVVCDLLGFNESVYQAVRRLAAKWCAEPSVHGGKARPKGAELVI